MAKKIGEVALGYYDGEVVDIYQDHYLDNKDAIAIFLQSKQGEPIGTLTKNHPNQSFLESDMFFVKTTEENEIIAQDCLNTGLFEDTGIRVSSGFIEFSIWRFKK